MTRYFVNAEGNYIGGFAGANPPAGAIEVPTPPADARQVFENGDWSAIPALVPDRVTARQFKLQLLAAGLLDEVDGWIGSQSKAVQVAYANSGTFVRGEPMMQAGFDALGFTSEQIDAFFTCASTL